jgi:hypothetical protein
VHLSIDTVKIMEDRAWQMDRALRYQDGGREEIPDEAHRNDGASEKKKN